jgi:kynureninase
VSTESPRAARETALALDATSPLREHRDRFDLPDDVVYLDGNSLGALPRSVADRVAEVVRAEWGVGLISSWNEADWMNLPRRVAAKIAPHIGVSGADVHVGDSTSVLLFKTMVAALRLRPERRVLVLEPTTFPTDGYVAAGLADLLDVELRWCDPADPAASLDEDVALLALTHVDFRSGAMYDLATLTKAAHAVGAVVQWDLCHSTGAVPVDLTAVDADFAVGCTYKYLNGGPGSPAFVYVAPRHQEALRQPITGWMGHARPFDMDLGYTPAPGVARMASGTTSSSSSTRGSARPSR